MDDAADDPRLPRKIDTLTLQSKLEQQDYQIDVRTIQRDLNKLSRALPLIGDEARPQGWSWRADAKVLDVPALDPQEALAFKMVEAHLKPLLPTATPNYLRPYFDSAKGVLDTAGNGVSKWPNKIRVLPKGLNQLPPKVNAEAQSVIYQALLQEKQVAVRYQPAGRKELTEYVVNPLSLVVRNSITYLVCTMWDYEDVRQLALHRVRKAELLESGSVISAAFDIDAYIAQGEFGFPQGGIIALEAVFAKAAALQIAECPISADQTVEEFDEDRMLLRASVQSTQELRWWLSGFGDQVEIKGPGSLREEFRRMTRAFARLYGSNSP